MEIKKLNLPKLIKFWRYCKRQQKKPYKKYKALKHCLR